MSNNILIVDDSVSVREVISIGLSDAGYHVIVGTNGENGLNILSKNDDIKLIITDLNMPVMDGITFLREIRKMERYKYLPVLILTTESQEQKKLEAKHAGATGWIVKPFVNEKLIEVVRKIIR